MLPLLKFDEIALHNWCYNFITNIWNYIENDLVETTQLNNDYLVSNVNFDIPETGLRLIRNQRFPKACTNVDKHLMFNEARIGLRVNH